MRYDATSLEGRFLAGEAEAHALVVRWVAQVLTLPRFRLLRREWSDTHQEVLGRIVESLRAGRFDPGLDFRVYAQSIARYTARDAVRRRLRDTSEPLRPDRLDADGPPVDARFQAREAVSTMMTELPESCRKLFHLFFYEQHSQPEISRRLGIPVGTVKSRLSRCLRRARDCMTEPRAVGRPTDAGREARS